MESESDDTYCKFLLFYGYSYVKTLQSPAINKKGFRKIRSHITVCLSINENNKPVVLKLTHKNTYEENAAAKIPIGQEADMFQRFPKHENIINYITSFYTKEYFVLVIEYLPEYEDLLDHLNDRTLFRKFKPAQAIRIFAQLIRAVDHLHSHGVAHLDIKPENILIHPQSLHVKLLDFEFSVNSQFSQRCCGSPEYISPEKFNGTYDTYMSDIWSLGVTFYVIFTCDLPFHDDDYYKLIQKVMKANYKPPCTDPYIVDLFRCMIQKDPSKRSTLAQLKKHLVWKTFGEIFIDADKKGIETDTSLLTSSSKLSDVKPFTFPTGHDSIENDTKEDNIGKKEIMWLAKRKIYGAADG